MPAHHLYLLRHATAEEAAAGQSDADRALLPKGKQQVRRVAAFCERHDLRPDVLLTSPLRRAMQTSHLLAARLHPGSVPETAEWLRLGVPTPEALAALAQRLDDATGSLWLVGHEPDLSSLLEELLGATAGSFRLKKASLSCLALAGPGVRGASLAWSLPCALMGG
jgi:phosphohistidine phosphatase